MRNPWRWWLAYLCAVALLIGYGIPVAAVALGTFVLLVVLTLVAWRVFRIPPEDR